MYADFYFYIIFWNKFFFLISNLTRIENSNTNHLKEYSQKYENSF